MTVADTSRLIDRVAALLSPHIGPDAADAVATEVVGDIQSRFYLIQIPSDEEASDLVQSWRAYRAAKGSSS